MEMINGDFREKRRSPFFSEYVKKKVKMAGEQNERANFDYRG